MKFFCDLDLCTGRDWIIFILKDAFVTFLIATFVAAVFFPWFILRIKALRIARKLLRESCPSYESPAKMIAHRFLNIYSIYNQPSHPTLESRLQRWERGGAWRSSMGERVLDEELEKIGLVELFTDESGKKRVRPSTTLSQNKKLALLVYKRVKRKLS